MWFEKPWFFNRNMLVLLNQNIEKRTLGINEFGNMNIAKLDNPWVLQFNKLCFFFQFSNVGNRQQASQARFSIYWREFLEDCPKVFTNKSQNGKKFLRAIEKWLQTPKFPWFFWRIFFFKPIIYDGVFF